MADHTEDALIREVNDELREEQMRQLWSRYGGVVVAAAILVVAIVAGYQGWKQYSTSTRMAEGEAFAAASQMAQNDPKMALDAFRALGAEASTGYGVLAKLNQAALMADTGDVAGAVQLYQQIARENSADPAISGLAIVLSAVREVNVGGYDRADLDLRLNAIAGPDHPYRYSARELLATIALEQGDMENARSRFADLAADASAPRGIRQRASDVLLGLGGPDSTGGAN